MSKGGNTSKNVEERKRKNRERMRRKRELIKENAVLYEESKRKERERYHRRVESGKIKKIKALTERSKRIQRKLWREKTKRSRANKNRVAEEQQAILDITPPSTPEPLGLQNDQALQQCHQRESGRKRARRNRRELKSHIKKLEQKVSHLKRKNSNYRVKLCRLKQKQKETLPDTPGKKVDALLDGQPVTEEVRKKVLFSEVVTAQLSENFSKMKSLKEKDTFVSCVTGSLIKKYRFQNIVNSVSSRKLAVKQYSPGKYEHQNNKMRQQKYQLVKQFLEKDEISRICPGKNDVITRKKIKKQKRLLNDSMQNIYRMFKFAYPKVTISYSLFCTLRPFYILPPSAKARETCLCSLHENMAMLVSKIKLLKIVDQSSPNEIVKTLCCSDQTEYCLERICNDCKEKTIQTNEFNRMETTSYKKWESTKVDVVIKGQEKKCQKTIKKQIVCTKAELVAALEASICKYMNHTNNITHQYKTVSDIKNSLTCEDVLVHLDFSENYNSKYTREVQSAHFGGSKEQICLHTVVFYYNCDETKSIKPFSLCTISENLRHDPAAILAHIQPIIFEINQLVPNLKNVHFLSDGPVTQYRNKKMFHLMGTEICNIMKVDSLQWHYSESGHGKGAPDGIGGCIKRTADRIVATGTDITNVDNLIDELNKNLQKIKIYKVGDELISKYDKLVPKEIAPFPGTLKIHQIAWSRKNPFILQVRRLSCLQCLPEEECKHYGIGSIPLKNPNLLPECSKRINYSDVYFSSSEDECTTSQPNKLKELAMNDFVLVKFPGKKCTKHYIAKILEIDSTKEYLVKFLRRSTGAKFIFPVVDDIATVDATDIACILTDPIQKRDYYIFEENVLFDFQQVY